MKHEIKCGSNFPVLEVTLNPGDEIVAESGAMCWMDTTVQCETSMRGGFLKGLKRAALGGESLFQNTFRVESGSGTVGLVPGQAGTIICHDLAEGELFMEKGAYLASTPDVQLDTKFQGLKGFFNEGLFILKVSGQGLIFFSGYGQVQSVEVDGEYIVDNGFAVAWDATLQYRLTKSGKRIRSFLFGDQLILRFKGRGRVWVQSHSPQALADWIYPFRPKKDNN